MGKMIDIKIPDYVTEIMTYLEASGFEAFVVGGCVRDSLCGKTPTDWDVCTSALPNCVKDIFDGIMTIIPTGEKHGTVTILSGGNAVEVTTFRSDDGYLDGRHPESVSFVPSIEEDLARRDFSVNAMAYNHSRGLIDLYGGRDDIDLNILRCVGDPQIRFQEDALRIMRALRFSAVCGFDIEKETEFALHQCRGLLKRVSAERIYEELKKILSAEAPSKILIKYRDIFEVIMPQAFSKEVFSADSSCLADKMPYDVSMRLAAILSTTDAEGIRDTLAELKAERATRRTVLLLCERSGLKPPADKVSVKYILKELGVADTKLLLEFCRAGALVSGGDARAFEYAASIIDEILADNECFSLKDLAINGTDIINLGSKEGCEVGEFLDKALSNVIEGNLPNKREDLIKFLSDKI